MTEKQQIIKEMTDIFIECDGNVIAEDIALQGCAGLVMFDEPIFGFSSPDDDIYQKFREKDVIGPNFMQPPEKTYNRSLNVWKTAKSKESE